MQNTKVVPIQIDLADYADFETDLKKYQEDKLKDNESFWKDAKASTENVISELLTASGALGEYSIAFQ